MTHVFIVGSKGIPANYGGYETFVDMLTRYQKDLGITYHVACAVDAKPTEETFQYNGAECFNIQRRPIGSARAIVYDLDALKWVIHNIEERDIENPIVYILACRIGPFFAPYVKAIHNRGGVVLVNPDGHEWLRAKWSAPVRRYWKLSEEGMAKHADLLVCDSKSIEKYIHEEYGKYNPQTCYISYGADLSRSKIADDDPKFTGWLAQHGLAANGYYLVVGRFVPENNYETMLREFMASDSKKDFALVTNVNDAFLDELDEKTDFRADPRIKFVGTMYDKELLKKIRENAFAYFHGHEVGGTNPSLLEALSSTRLNLLLDVGFNREVAEDSALYWTKERGALARLITQVEQMPSGAVNELDRRSTHRIATAYSWDLIVSLYEELFLSLSQ